LFSNFTFYLNDPVNGDQIQQKESRMMYGYKANYNASSMLFGKELKSHMGGGIRYDDVKDIALSNTIKREYRSDVQLGNLTESNVNAFVSETLILSERWSVNTAMRFDRFTFAYDNKISGEYKSNDAYIVSPKLSINYAINHNTQVYARTGTGFHSNDTRVVVEQNAKEILPSAYGVDLGIDTKLIDKILVHAALWRLDLEQEFVYVGDAGIVQPRGKSQRQGIDLSIRYQVLPWLFIDTDITLADPKAKGEVDDNIPLAPKFSSIGGLTFRMDNGLNGSLRYRCLDDRAANEDNSVIAQGYFLMDGAIHYTKPKFEVGMSIENMLNAAWKEAQFNTESRMFNEAQPVSELHFTPGTPLFAKFHISFFF
jgi:outer membrane receptor protein involved in Fe transport